MASQKILELNNLQARNFLKEGKSYVNFDLPFYFNFNNLITVASGLMYKKKLEDICRKTPKSSKIDWPLRYEGVNYIVLDNKDGAFSWRPYELIHPILYVDLVNLITEKNNWKFILKRFQDFSKGCVKCISIPRISTGEESHKASQVSHWWDEIEQRSLKMALKYKYIFSTDITNCYSSIYTHSIEWALTKGGRSTVKKAIKQKRTNKSTGSLGHEIDRKLMNMNCGQTNGIPQGSVLMDFIAEIVLGYADLELTEALKNIKSKDFEILRYRDDYRILVNNPEIGYEILKKLNNVLYGLGMKMNPGKTQESDDVILSSIKKEKLEIISTAPVTQSLQKEALRIYQLAKNHPNAGLISKELGSYFDRISNLKWYKNTNIEVLVSIFCMIAINSPKTINWISTIISKLLTGFTSKTKITRLVKAVHKKFEKMPNTGLVDVWLQRISAPLGIKIEYQDNLTRIATGDIKISEIWECSWMKKTQRETLNKMIISDLSEKLETKEIPPVISRKEVELFRVKYN